MILSKRHTGLVVRDLERSVIFYEALGLTVWKRATETGKFIDAVVGIQAVKLEWAKLRAADDSVVELLQYHSHPDMQQVGAVPSNRLGCSHISFTVDDIARTCDDIVKLGGSLVNQPVTAPSGTVRVAYCHDIDGILIEIVEEVHRNG